MSDNEHAAPPLRHSKPLAVQNRPCQTKPEVIKRGEEASEIFPVVCGQYPWHVLPEEPSRLNALNSLHIAECKARSGVSEALSVSGLAEALAGRASDNKVNRSTILAPIDFCYVSKIRDTWIMMP
jgi:hypothetical protein